MQYQVTGHLPQIFGNTDGLYDGTLWHYLPFVLNAPNKLNGYHNTRHTLHVTWMCYEAAKFYQDHLSKRKIRNVLIGGIKHDYGQSGRPVHVIPDEENLRVAEASLRSIAAPEDRPYLDDIANIMWATHFPHKHIEHPSLEQRIIRDADLSQALHPAWFDIICIGLGSEWGKTALEMLEIQEPFLRSITFETDWAKERFPPEAIEQKIVEVNKLLAGLRSVS